MPKSTFKIARRNADGRWQKRHDSKLFYAPKRLNKADATQHIKGLIAAHDAERKALATGGVVKMAADEMTVKGLMNLFMEKKEKHVQQGRISQRTYDDLLKTCGRIIDCIGGRTRIAELDRARFANLRDCITRRKDGHKYGATAQQLMITRARQPFNFAVRDEGIPVRGIGELELLTKQQLRQDEHERQAGKITLSAEECRQVIKAADPNMRAFILLGLNAGIEATAFAEIKPGDFSDGFYGTPHDCHKDAIRPGIRKKTGERRAFHLWPETIAAIDAAGGGNFRNSHGGKFTATTISGRIRRLMDDCGIECPGSASKIFRKTFNTVAMQRSSDGDTRKLVMGHVLRDLSTTTYADGWPRQKLIDISDAVHGWLFGDEPKRTTEST